MLLDTIFFWTLVISGVVMLFRDDLEACGRDLRAPSSGKPSGGPAPGSG